MDNLMLQLMGAFAQFEREIILERQKELNSPRLKGSTKAGYIN
jgi:DNA invertase Pin-like site-specific DNA recombinase